MKNPETKRRMTISVLFALTVLILTFVTAGLKAFIFVFICALGLILISVIDDIKRYRNIAELSDKVNKLLYEDIPLEISSHQEGEMGILQSEIRKMTIKIREQNSALANDKELMQKSMADISHQLRTPLTSINLIVTLLRKNDITKAERQRYINELAVLLDRMDWLIGDILKMSQLEAGVISLKNEKVDLKEVVARASEPIQIPLELRSIELAVKISENSFFKGDMRWTCEAVENILKNCMEHTPAGGKISVCCVYDPFYCKLEISDTGCGINQKDIPHIFERFYKPDKSYAKGGFGIGLALARQIITGEHGYVSVENLPNGSGAKFIILLQAADTDRYPL